MKYVRLEDENKARRLANFAGVGSIDKSGSVVGMQNKFGWQKGGQVRLGGYIYNVGPSAVERLKNHNLLQG
jgi:hypothetical protein